MTARSPRDPVGRRRAIVEAAASVIAQRGVAGLTHRLVARAAGVPVGSTTYYFTDLDQLRREALAHAAKETVEELDFWREELERSHDVPDSLARLAVEYLSGEQRYRTLNELYTAAMYQPELRGLARQWADGLVGLLLPFAGRQEASDVVAFIDGVIIRGLIDDRAPDRARIADAIRRLLAGRVIQPGRT